jgi:hypothetical protein
MNNLAPILVCFIATVMILAKSHTQARHIHDSTIPCVLLALPRVRTYGLSKEPSVLRVPRRVWHFKFRDSDSETFFGVHGYKPEHPEAEPRSLADLDFSSVPAPAAMGRERRPGPPRTIRAASEGARGLGQTIMVTIMMIDSKAMRPAANIRVRIIVVTRIVRVNRRRDNFKTIFKFCF